MWFTGGWGGVGGVGGGVANHTHSNMYCRTTVAKKKIT